MRSGLATDVPPYFCTINAITAKDREKTHILPKVDSVCECLYMVWWAYQWQNSSLTSDAEFTMTPQALTQAAQLLWNHWQHSTRLAALPEVCRPKSRVEGYAIQAQLAALSGQATLGWKIAATTLSGQR